MVYNTVNYKHDVLKAAGADTYQVRATILGKAENRVLVSWAEENGDLYSAY